MKISTLHEDTTVRSLIEMTYTEDRGGEITVLHKRKEFMSANEQKRIISKNNPVFAVNDFTCKELELTSLEGCPTEIGGDFNIYRKSSI